MDAKPDQLGDLLRLREQLIAAAQLVKPRELPAISRELRQIGAAIADLSPNAEVSLVDDLAARRADRLAGANKAGASAKGG